VLFFQILFLWSCNMTAPKDSAENLYFSDKIGSVYQFKNDNFQALVQVMNESNDKLDLYIIFEEPYVSEVSQQFLIIEDFLLSVPKIESYEEVAIRYQVEPDRLNFAPVSKTLSSLDLINLRAKYSNAVYRKNMSVVVREFGRYEFYDIQSIMRRIHNSNNEKFPYLLLSDLLCDYSIDCKNKNVDNSIAYETMEELINVISSISSEDFRESIYPKLIKFKRNCFDIEDADNTEL